MSNDSIPIRQFLANWDAGEYKSPDVHTQIKAGWYDWFCKDSSLPRKTENLVKKLKRIVDSPLINLRRLKTEGTPLCPRCSGRSIFTGNEKPDGRWIKRWKHHFLCIACRSSFHRVADDPCEIKVGEGDDDAKEPQE